MGGTAKAVEDFAKGAGDLVTQVTQPIEKEVTNLFAPSGISGTVAATATPAPEASPKAASPMGEMGGMGDASLQVVVFGPDGTAYGSPAQAIAAGVNNYTMSPPSGSGMPMTGSPFGPMATPGQILSPTTSSLKFLSNPFNTNTTSAPSAFQPMRNTAAPSPIAAPTPQQYSNAGVFSQVFNPTPTALPLFSPMGPQLGQGSGMATPAPVPENNQDFDTSYNNLLSGFYPRKLM
jgi:hypothetical protein